MEMWYPTDLRADSTRIPLDVDRNAAAVISWLPDGICDIELARDLPWNTVLVPDIRPLQCSHVLRPPWSYSGLRALFGRRNRAWRPRPSGWQNCWGPHDLCTRLNRAMQGDLKIIVVSLRVLPSVYLPTLGRTLEPKLDPRTWWRTVC